LLQEQLQLPHLSHILLLALLDQLVLQLYHQPTLRLSMQLMDISWLDNHVNLVLPLHLTSNLVLELLESPLVLMDIISHQELVLLVMSQDQEKEPLLAQVPHYTLLASTDMY